MIDGWSLEGKIGLEEGTPVDKNGNLQIYEKKYIETLRQKLIEDLTKIDGAIYHYLADEDRILAKRTIKEVINKRFGVKE